MCIKVYEEEINSYYRFICLITFLIVILFSNNIVTYAILLVLVFIRNVKKQSVLIDSLFILSFIIFIISIIFNYYFLLKIMIIINYMIYFLEIRSIRDLNVKEKKDNRLFNDIYDYNKKKISNQLKKGEKIDNKIMNEVYKKSLSDLQRKQEVRLLRFASKKNSYNINSDNTYYVAFHLIILFISILIGSCAI